MNKIAFTIYSEPASKSNSRRLVKFGNRPALIKSDKARKYEKTALMQIPENAKQMLEGNLRATIKIFYATQRPDLDESIILDCLQAKYKNGELLRRGAYINDRQIKQKKIFSYIDKANPRAEILIEEIIWDKNDLLATTLEDLSRR